MYGITHVEFKTKKQNMLNSQKQRSCCSKGTHLVTRWCSPLNSLQDYRPPILPHEDSVQKRQTTQPQLPQQLARKLGKQAVPEVHLREGRASPWKRGVSQDPELTLGIWKGFESLTQWRYECKVFQDHTEVQASLSLVKKPLFLREVHSNVFKA